ncbi:MAG TPA: Lrp/AsnC family transcriptional regulator [Thermoplasmatales archaeon]|nr:Lrp/AsnC family transcriptional regulator [Thermoplasmatales archaeon]HEX16901.1 Lrp/AsnC family transcriptional regulator [Thermoplasmatales archaeon]
MPKIVLDEKDLKILNRLCMNSRTSIRKLADTLGMKPSSVFNRLKRLERTGVIRRYTLEIDYRLIGKDVQAFVFVRYDPSSKREQDEVAKDIIGIDGCEEVDIITGEWDLLVHVRTSDIPSLSNIILNRIRKVEGVYHTFSAIVLKSLRSQRCV